VLVALVLSYGVAACSSSSSDSAACENVTNEDLLDTISATQASAVNAGKKMGFCGRTGRDLHVLTETASDLRKQVPANSLRFPPFLAVACHECVTARSASKDEDAPCGGVT
jgi:hypothetical protein